MALGHAGGGGSAAEWWVSSDRIRRSLAFRPAGAAGYWNCHCVLDRCGNAPLGLRLAPADRRGGSHFVHASPTRDRTDRLDSAFRYGGYLRRDNLSRLPATA